MNPPIMAIAVLGILGLSSCAGHGFGGKVKVDTTGNDHGFCTNAFCAKREKAGFSFVYFADSHVNTEAAGKLLFDRMAEMAALTEKPMFVVAGGDLVDDGNRLSDYTEYRAAIMSSDLPVFNVIGNHDAPVAHFQSVIQQELSYSFDFGNKHFVVLNDQDQECHKWLKSRLDATPKDRDIYVFQHYPASRELLDLLSQYNVKAVFFGHWHSNKAFRYGTVLVFSTPPPRFGGIDASPAGFRYVSIAPDGSLKTEMRLAGINAHLVILNPSGAEPAVAPLRVRAAVYDTAIRVRQMQCRIDQGAWKEMNPAGGWLWESAEIREALSGGKHVVRVRASAASSAIWEREAAFDTTDRQADPGRVSYRLAWRTYVGGEHILSASVICGNRIYTSVADNDNVENSGLVCLDAATGAIIWKRPTDCSVNGAPVLGDGVVCGVSVVGTIYAWDAQTGVALWTNRMEDGYKRWFYNSPVISSNVVFCGEVTRVAALDLKTGKELWRANPQGGISCRASPAVDDRFVYFGVNWGSAGLSSFDRQTGRVVWNKKEGYNATHATPVPRGEILFCAANDRLYALDRMTGKEIWNAAPGGSWPVSSLTIVGNTAAMGSGDGKVVAFDAQNGRTLWSFQTGPSIGSFEPYQWGGSLVMGAPLIAEGKVYVGANDGKIYVLDLCAGKKLWDYDLGVPVASSPAVFEDMLYVTTFDGNIFAFRRE